LDIDADPPKLNIAGRLPDSPLWIDRFEKIVFPPASVVPIELSRLENILRTPIELFTE